MHLPETCTALDCERTAGRFHTVTYASQSARDAAASGYGGPTYAAYLDRHARELAARFPDRADEFLTRSLSEALAGNDGP